VFSEGAKTQQNLARKLALNGYNFNHMYQTFFHHRYSNKRTASKFAPKFVFKGGKNATKFGV
jgi:hypothetical protein